jgi:putative effector of murein hydrolase
MESALTHLFHSVILTVILYLLMIFILKQSQNMALNRSILIGAIALIYMILFGHGMPTHINRI